MASTQGRVGVCTLPVEHSGTRVKRSCPEGSRAASKRHKCEWRPSLTSEHPAAMETYLNSGGTATRVLSTVTESNRRRSQGR